MAHNKYKRVQKFEKKIETIIFQMKDFVILLFAAAIASVQVGTLFDLQIKLCRLYKRNEVMFIVCQCGSDYCN